MIEIKTHKLTKSVLVKVDDQIRLHRRGIEQAFYEIGKDVVDETARLIKSGTRSGRTYSFNGRPHKASAGGEVPANRTGRLADSGDYKVSGYYQMRVGETAEYAKFLEDGTRKMRPRPHLIVAINNKARDTYRSLMEYAIREIGYK